MTGEIAVAAVILVGPDGKTLLVRKRGTQRFMQPGGKREPGETFREAAVREVLEETGLALDPAALAEHGVFRAQAANEAGMTVVAHVFSAFVDGAVRPAAEIVDHAWVEPGGETGLPLAPLTEHHMLALAQTLTAMQR